jgi:hypothetical protein
MLEAEPTQAVSPLIRSTPFTTPGSFVSRCTKGVGQGRRVPCDFLFHSFYEKKIVPNPKIRKALTPLAMRTSFLRDQLNNTTSLLDLLLGQAAHPPGADDQGNLGQAALAEDLGVAEGEEVEDRDGVLLGASDVSIAGLGGNERPKLVKVDDGLPEVNLLLVEVPHTNLSEVTRVVLVHVGTVMVLATSQTSTSRMLPVLANATLTSRNVAAVLARLGSSSGHCDGVVVCCRFRECWVQLRV